MLNIVQETRFAFRYLTRNLGTTVAAVLTMALGIGACTAIFSVVQGVLLKPLPYPDPDSIIQVWQVSSRSGTHMQTSDPNFLEWQEQNTSFAGRAEYSSGINSIVGGTEPVRTRVGTVSRDFFEILGVQPFRGRTFTSEELVQGGNPAVIVSYGFWQRYLNSDPRLSSQALSFSNRNHSIVGVMPSGFKFPVGAELWIPRELFARNASRTAHNWRVIGRLKPGTTLESGRQEMYSIGRNQHQAYGEDIWLRDIDLVPLREEMVGAVRTQLLLLLGAVGFLLLVACANITNLLLPKAAARRKELAVRSALGASRWDLERQSVLESLLMTLAGGLLGMGLAAAGVRLLLFLEPDNLPRIAEIEISTPVLIFALGLSAVTALLLGLLPMFRLTRQSMYTLLKEGGRGQISGSSSAHLRNSLVVAQVALTLVLLVGAGLLARSFQKLLEMDPGFLIEDSVTLQITQPRPRN